ncbi:MAG: hypothetical protein DLM57_09510 [Pseudonocardiales bacterium]|nr:MAG: hypothetical protein DLM57_09510 [Pseudonocardiales bacterium]
MSVVTGKAVAAAAKVVATITLLAAGVGACSATVDGTGHVGRPSSHGNDFPSAPSTDASTDATTSVGPPPTSSSAPPAGAFTCPTITYPGAHLRFDCITAGLALSTHNAIWPVTLNKSVEASGWVLEEGAGNWGPPGSQSAADIALEVRDKMVAGTSYGPSPTLKIDLNADATVGGVPAHILQTTITINPMWAKQRGTKVSVEKLWIVVVKVSPTDDALWYTSIPNLASQLWANVPAVIKTIRVT